MRVFMRTLSQLQIPIFDSNHVHYNLCFVFLILSLSLSLLPVSVTKFIGGHSDVVMGSISCNDKVSGRFS